MLLEHQHCSNNIFILDLTSGFNGLGQDNCKTIWETFKFWDLVHLILEVWWYCMLTNSLCKTCQARVLPLPVPPLAPPYQCQLRTELSPYRVIMVTPQWLIHHHPSTNHIYGVSQCSPWKHQHILNLIDKKKCLDPDFQVMNFISLSSAKIDSRYWYWHA